MPRRTITAHLPSNFAGFQFERALRSVAWADHAVVHDASLDGSVSALARRVRPDVITVEDRDPDIRARLLRHRDATADDYLIWVQSDEDWSGPVAEEILAFLASDSPATGLEVFNESFYFLESFGDRGPYCRVVRRDRLRFPGESLHDMPDPEGDRLTLRGRFLHDQDQNMILFWVKNYKYAVIEHLASASPARPHPLDREGPLPPLAVLRYLLKINLHFLRGWWQSRDRGLAGLFWAQDLMIRQITNELVPLEARRLQRAGRQYETAGHVHMPELPAPANPAPQI